MGLDTKNAVNRKSESAANGTLKKSNDQQQTQKPPKKGPTAGDNTAEGIIIYI